MQTVLVQTVLGQAVIYPAISKDVFARTLEQLKTEGYAVKEQSENGAILEKDGLTVQLTVNQKLGMTVASLTRKVTAVAAARVSAPGTGTRHRARTPRPQSWLTAPDQPPLPPPLRRPLPNRPKLLDLYCAPSPARGSRRSDQPLTVSFVVWNPAASLVSQDSRLNSDGATRLEGGGDKRHAYSTLRAATSCMSCCTALISSVLMSWPRLG